MPSVPEDVTDISTLANLHPPSVGQDCRGILRGYWNSTMDVVVRTAKMAIQINGSQMRRTLLRVIIGTAKGRSSVVY